MHVGPKRWPNNRRSRGPVGPFRPLGPRGPFNVAAIGDGAIAGAGAGATELRLSCGSKKGKVKWGFHQQTYTIIL